MEVLLTLPQDVHDWPLKSFTTTRQGEERRRSLGFIVCIEDYASDQLFNVEYLVHRKVWRMGDGFLEVGSNDTCKRAPNGWETAEDMRC